jgi:hypothetical protein
MFTTDSNKRAPSIPCGTGHSDSSAFVARSLSLWSLLFTLIRAPEGTLAPVETGARIHPRYPEHGELALDDYLFFTSSKTFPAGGV